MSTTRKIESTLVEANFLRDIKKLLGDDKKGCPIFFDLDETVMMSTLILASSAWFDLSIKKAVAEAASEAERVDAIAAILAVYLELQKIIRAKPVEDETAAIIAELQQTLPIIALTARDRGIAASTRRQLIDIGVDFAANAHIPNGTHDFDLQGKDGKPNPLYQDGIIFCCGHNKGEVVRLFLQHYKLQPRHVLMVEDKLSNLQHVKRALEEMNEPIPFTGVHYRRLDEHVRQSTLAEANAELEHVRDRLSPQAKTHLERLGIKGQYRHPSLSETNLHRYFYPASPPSPPEAPASSLLQCDLIR